MRRKVELIVVGAGNRGSIYASYALQHPALLKITGVAEPRAFYAQRLKRLHGISDDNVHADWHCLAKRKKFADGVIIATGDSLHVEPAIAFAKKRYHILIEKPMAPNECDCRRIVEAVRASGVMLSVCHGLRHARHVKRIKSIIDSGRIGEVVSIQHLEGVGFHHQAFSFVRGPWRNESLSSFMLLAKSCHDIDYLYYLMGARCVRVSSFGGLKHFRREERPEHAADRCLDCALEPECPYSARHMMFDVYKSNIYRLYILPPDIVERKLNSLPSATPGAADALYPKVTDAEVMEALREGPFGRCVYACDNDVVDHQVVNMLFEGNRTASFTMTAFSRGGRWTRIFGTRGELSIEGAAVSLYDPLEHKTETIELPPPDPSIHPNLRGHGYSDYNLMDNFVKAVSENEPGHIASGPEDSLESHLIVFAAERARRENRIVDL